MVNALNFGIADHKNIKTEIDRAKIDKYRNAHEISKEEESKVEKFQRTIESGAYRLDMEKTARAIVGF